jgi:hypothetical protein
MLKNFIAGCGAIGILLTPFSTMSLRAEDGVWSPTNTVAQVNVACTRVYLCTPGKDILHSSETKVTTTPPKLVFGVCSAGGGPIDSCNDCLTNPPRDKCEWHLEKR